MLYLTDRHGTFAVAIGGWGDKGYPNGPLGITLVVDQLAALMLVVSTIVLLCVVVYAIGQGIRDGTSQQPVSIFLPTYLILCAGVCNSFLAGDLFNLFVSFEILLSASFVLLTLGASGERVRAGASYVMVSMLSSLVFLSGIAFAYATTGTLNLAEMALRLDTVADGTRNALFRRLGAVRGTAAHHSLRAADLDAGVVRELEREAGRRWPRPWRDAILDSFLATFEKRYATTRSDYTQAELEAAEQLMDEKFSTPEWTHRVP